jgi:hypothetical protein
MPGRSICRGFDLRFETRSLNSAASRPCQSATAVCSLPLPVQNQYWSLIFGTASSSRTIKSGGGSERECRFLGCRAPASRPRADP